MTSRLSPIVAHKEQEVKALYANIQQAPESALAKLCQAQLKLPACKSFKSALKGNQLAVIAEIKRKSPSKGALADITDPLALASTYQEHGASAISILTDTPFFGGGLADLQQVATHLATCKIPLLRKDFMIDNIQLAEARLAGADAVLAIVAILGHKTKALLNDAKALGLDVLVEVHDEAELDLALSIGAEIIGINNRNLQTMTIDTKQALRLVDRIPNDIVKVAESGILVTSLAKQYRQAGFDAVLIGEALVKSENPGAFIRECMND